MSTSKSPESNLRRRNQVPSSGGGERKGQPAASKSADAAVAAATLARERAEETKRVMLEVLATATGGSLPTPKVRVPHLRQPSDGFGAFVDAAPGPAGVDPWGPMGGSSSDEEWHDASLVTSFSPPSSAQLQPAELPDWDAWESGAPSKAVTPGLTGSTSSLTPGTLAGSTSMNPADDAFFAAFERAAVEANARAPSPPIIDLRPVERKLDAAVARAKAPSSAMITSAQDMDFFARFERADSMPRRKEEPGLKGQALEYMTEARLSPMEAMEAKPSPAKDYFGDEAESSAGERKQQVVTPEQEPASWTGSLKRTWGSIRGLPAGLAEHLPDLIVPPDDASERRGSGTSVGSGDSAASAAKSAQRKSASGLKRAPIPHASDYSHASPFGATSPPGTSTLASGSFSGSGGASRFAASQPVMSIPGAPGFDASSERRWNTGSWSMTSEQEQARTRRPIAVTMQGRRAETDAVLTQWHASRLQASLPPRSQLGTTWKLLYSLDQQGISLATLYASVASGLSGNATGSLSPGLEAAEGWMRGASSAAKAAVGAGAKAAVKGSSLRHVGGGLALADAGIVIAVQDTDDNVFGAYINERLRPQSSYYGSGECFLWKTTRSPTASTTGAENQGKDIRVFRWTGANDYVALTEAHYLSVGGGNDGRYGLWLDGKLEKGVSARSTTFDNNILCNDEPGCSADGKEGHFECLGLEVWAVGVD